MEGAWTAPVVINTSPRSLDRVDFHDRPVGAGDGLHPANVGRVAVPRVGAVLTDPQLAIALAVAELTAILSLAGTVNVELAGAQRPGRVEEASSALPGHGDGVDKQDLVSGTLDAAALTAGEQVGAVEASGAAVVDKELLFALAGTKGVVAWRAYNRFG